MISILELIILLKNLTSKFLISVFISWTIILLFRKKNGHLTNYLSGEPNLATPHQISRKI